MRIVRQHVRPVGIFGGLVEMVVRLHQLLLREFILPPQEQNPPAASPLKTLRHCRVEISENTRCDCTLASFFSSNSYSLTGTFAACPSTWRSLERLKKLLKVGRARDPPTAGRDLEIAQELHLFGDQEEQRVPSAAFSSGCSSNPVDVLLK